jgi:hypothetical protein
MDVIPLTRQWEFNIGRNESTGTRVYVTSTVMITPPTVFPLPEMFESWSVDWPDVLVNSIAYSYLDGGCGREYIVQYSSNIIAPGNSTARSARNSLSINSQFFHYTDHLDKKDNAGKPLTNVNLLTTHWEWPDSSLADNIPFTISEQQMGWTYTRDMYASMLPEYLQIVQNSVGKLNDTTILGVPSGCMLFLGADVSESSLYNGKRWSVKLQFSIRALSGITTTPDTWQQIYQPVTNSYGIVKTDSGDLLYEYTNFDSMLSAFDIAPLYPG